MFAQTRGLIFLMKLMLLPEPESWAGHAAHCRSGGSGCTRSSDGPVRSPSRGRSAHWAPRCDGSYGWNGSHCCHSTCPSRKFHKTYPWKSSSSWSVAHQALQYYHVWSENASLFCTASAEKILPQAGKRALHQTAQLPNGKNSAKPGLSLGCKVLIHNV